MSHFDDILKKNSPDLSVYANHSSADMVTWCEEIIGTVCQPERCGISREFAYKVLLARSAEIKSGKLRA